ncbi:hypothetical protein Patl1_23212 [Pistacia atlantica]|uniref:Uncharacterized protein n=1 Tax=Pistacia atlantica TaxID=434234 RepID=A0ACC0ZVD5_9ROSI|nr:hypothetical protein Patl1_23212 [Pistacia atlantica]
MMKEVHSEKNNIIAVGVDDKPLSFFGCGIGWFSFLLGFVFPPLWYYATVLYLGKYYLKDPRERSGLAASAIANLTLNQNLHFLVIVPILVHNFVILWPECQALICSVALLVVLLVVFL